MRGATLLRAVTIATAALAVSGAHTADQQASKPDLLARGIRVGIERSPSQYLAGVLERTSAPTCSTSAAGKQRCWASYSVKELIAWQPVSSDAPASVKLECSPDAGPVKPANPERALVFAVPSSFEAGVYSATVIAAQPTAGEVETFRQRLPLILGS